MMAPQARPPLRLISLPAGHSRFLNNPRERLAYRTVVLMSNTCHGQTFDTTLTVLLLLRAHEERRGHRRGHLRPRCCLSAEPAAAGAALRKRGAARWPHQYGPDPHAARLRAAR